ncbi:MAG: zf-TFIIB domain-containing protein, partial [Pseudomonadota bacterium]
SERMGIEIDYCPKCRGVWLDRGELDKIIERSMTEASLAPPAPSQAGAPQAAPSGYAPDPRGGYYDDHGGYGGHGGGHGGHGSSHHGRSYGGRHGRSFLGRLFD